MLALAGFLSSFGVLATSTPAAAAGEGTILSLVNQARAEHGKGPLKLNSAMNAVALAWAKHMAAANSMVHNPNYSKQIPGGWTRAGENIAHGFASPAAVHEAWMNSSGHRANILGDYTDIGIAFITVDGSTWAVEDFGKYGASSKPKTPKPPAAPKPAKPPKSPPTTKPASGVRPASPSSPAKSTAPAPAEPYVPDLSFLPAAEFTAPSPAPSPVAPLPQSDPAASPTPATEVQDDAARPPGMREFLPAGILLGLLLLGAWSSTGLLLWRRWRKV
jgi:hypothetical protein